MHPFFRNFTRRPFIVLSLIYLLFRLPNLVLLPIFSDEAVYVEWAWRMTHVSGLAFHSLTDGKQPLLMWLFGFIQNFFFDPLLASRLVSVGTGLLNLWLIYLLAHRLFSVKTAILSSLFYIFIPFFSFFDRQALMESSLVTISLSSFYLLFRLYTRPSFATSFVLGSVLGLGFLIKSTPTLFFASIVIIHLVYSLKHRDRLYSQLSFTLVSLIAFLLTALPLFLQPVFWSTLYRTGDYALPVSTLLHLPFTTWLKNLWSHLEIFNLNFTPVIAFAAALGVYRLKSSPSLPHRLLVAWCLVPLGLYLLVVRNSNSLAFRYLTPFIPLLILPAADFLSRSRTWAILSLLLPIFFTTQLILFPQSYFYLKSRLTQYSYIESYVTGFDTGYQVEALRTYIDHLAASQPIVLTTAVHTFNPESALAAYYRRDPQVQFAYLDGRLIGDTAMSEIDCLSSDLPVYFVAKLNDTAKLDKYLEFVTVVTNPYNPDYATIYTLKTNCTGPTSKLNLTQN